MASHGNETHPEQKQEPGTAAHRWRTFAIVAVAALCLGFAGGEIEDRIRAGIAAPAGAAAGVSARHLQLVEQAAWLIGIRLGFEQVCRALGISGPSLARDYSEMFYDRVKAPYARLGHDIGVLDRAFQEGLSVSAKRISQGASVNADTCRSNRHTMENDIRQLNGDAI